MKLYDIRFFDKDAKGIPTGEEKILEELQSCLKIPERLTCGQKVYGGSLSPNIFQGVKSSVNSFWLNLKRR